MPPRVLRLPVRDMRLTAMTRRSDEEITASNDPSRFVIRGRAQEAEATTDDAGRYEFAGIGEGQYLLRAESRGYVMALYGSPRWPIEQDLVPIALEAGQHLNRIDLALKSGGSIRGRVVDEAGRPLRRRTRDRRRKPGCRTADESGARGSDTNR